MTVIDNRYISSLFPLISNTDDWTPKLLRFHSSTIYTIFPLLFRRYVIPGG